MKIWLMIMLGKDFAQQDFPYLEELTVVMLMKTEPTAKQPPAISVQLRPDFMLFREVRVADIGTG